MTLITSSCDNQPIVIRLSHIMVEVCLKKSVRKQSFHETAGHFNAKRQEKLLPMFPFSNFRSLLFVSAIKVSVYISPSAHLYQLTDFVIKGLYSSITCFLHPQEIKRTESLESCTHFREICDNEKNNSWHII